MRTCRYGYNAGSDPLLEALEGELLLQFKSDDFRCQSSMEAAELQEFEESWWKCARGGCGVQRPPGGPPLRKTKISMSLDFNEPGNVQRAWKS